MEAVCVDSVASDIGSRISATASLQSDYRGHNGPAKQLDRWMDKYICGYRNVRSRVSAMRRSTPASYDIWVAF